VVTSVILSVLGGCVLVIARILNGQLGARAGVKFSTLMNYLTGAAGSLILLIVTGSGFAAAFPKADLPIVYYTGGMIGVAAVMLGVWATSRAPSVQVTLLIFVAQLFMSMMLDAFFLNKFSMGRLIGGGIVLIGAVLNVIGDQKNQAGGRK